MKPQVLVVDDDRATRDLLRLTLGTEGFDVATAGDWAEAMERFGAQDFDVVLTDLNLGGPNGIDLCRRLADQRPDTPVIVITAFGSLDTAISAMRAGAYDFLTKPFESESVVVALTRALRHRELTREVRRLRVATREVAGFGGLLGSSPPMLRLYTLLDRVAASEASVLIQGESGTGKEMVARALHDRGPRRERPFVAINCSALPEQLLESELFGHTRGAFTDAKEARAGLFAEANGGTLFFDEVGDLPLGLQPKLLRALEQRSVRPLGGKSEVPFDVRVVTATHRDLEQAIQEGTFREDLYYRLNVINVVLPPLRARGNDVLILAQHFLERLTGARGSKVAGISRGAADKLLRYPWPGNVRELRNCIERALALTAFDKIAAEDLPEKVRAQKAARVVAHEDSSELVPLEEVERRYIFQVLAACKGNRSQAAQILGLNRKTLYRKLQDYEGG
ncbi:MAG TPA: sigma-54 dependent transcriptional regulator [Polyangiaceae bacterium]